MRLRRTALMQKAQEARDDGAGAWASYWVHLARKENKKLLALKKVPVTTAETICRFEE